MAYLLVLFILGAIITIHELGHFVAARCVGIPIELFSIGFGPKLWSFRRGGTEYRLAAIPLGGYVLPRIEDDRAYLRIPLTRRVLFSLGGPAANVLSTLLLLAVLNSVANGFSCYGFLVAPFAQCAALMLQILDAIAGLFGSHSANLTGVVGMVALGGHFVGFSLIRALSFAVMINLNLAVFNLLPLPPLDGGKIVLDIAHAIHPKVARLYAPAMMAGWVLIGGLFVYTLIADSARLLA